MNQAGETDCPAQKVGGGKEKVVHEPEGKGEKNATGGLGARNRAKGVGLGSKKDWRERGVGVTGTLQGEIRG